MHAFVWLRTVAPRPIVIFDVVRFINVLTYLLTYITALSRSVEWCYFQ